jgi:O-succinylbenzoate synthase
MRSRPWCHPRELAEAMTAVRGHSFAKAAFESVLWDLLGQSEGMSVAHLLADDPSQVQPWVEVGPSVGIKESPDRLVEAVGRELAKGYRRVKVKVCPGKDVAYLDAVRAAYPDITLMVDANAAYQPDDIGHLAAWDRYDLVMIEQPLDHDDLWFHRQLCERMETPICLDESIQTPHLARCAIEMKAADIVNIKVGRVAGLVNTKRIHDMCQQAGVPIWIGSRLGSGIAEAGRLAAASLLNATFPTDVGAGLSYMADDLVDGWFELRGGCEAKVPIGPGLGIRVNRDKLERYTVEIAEW